MKSVIQAINKLTRFVFGDEGSTLAEMAIMVPFLAVMLGGVSEFGRFFQTQATLAKATRTGARYLSNHPFNDTEKARAQNLVVCGKLTCAGGDELLPDLTTANVCIESSPSDAPVPTTITVRIPSADDDPCGSPYYYQPVFDLGALLHTPAFSLELPIRPSTTMYFMLDN